MKTLRKIFIFIVTLSILFSTIYIFPLHMIVNSTYDEGNFTMYDSPYYKHYSNIMKSNIDTEYKGDLVSMFTQSSDFQKEQRNMFYTIIMYCAIILHLVLIASSIFIIKATKIKFFGKCVLTSSILSTIYLVAVINSFYLYINV